MKQEKKEWVIIKVLEGEHAGEYLPALRDDLDFIGTTEDARAIMRHRAAGWEGVPYYELGKLTGSQLDKATAIFNAGFKAGKEKKQ